MVTIPRVIIAGTQSGVGKTTVAMGLMAAFTRRGLHVQPFKAGPDYIDPSYHTVATGRACRNLDTWLLTPARVRAVFQHASAGSSLSVIEGVMGLFDGHRSTHERGSTAELAKLLKAPVILVVDGSCMARSAAAMIQGFATFDPAVRVAGVIFNKVGPRHFELLRDSLRRTTPIPALGYLPNDPALAMPERHLGLIPAQEDPRLQRVQRRLCELLPSCVNLAALLTMARSAPRLPAARPLWPVPHRHHAPVRIGLARDQAFHFYYEENLELLQALGVEVVPFSPLTDRTLPEALDGVYLGGGFPERFADRLAANVTMRRAMKHAIRRGLPTYAECGGLMYLAKRLGDMRGRLHAMVGVLPGVIRLTRRLQSFGYSTVIPRRSTILADVGDAIKGHEFHYSAWEHPVSRREAAYTVLKPRQAPRLEGFAHGNVLASYIHVHFLTNPRWARGFVASARRFQERRLANCLTLLLLVGAPGGLGAQPPARLEEVVVTATRAPVVKSKVTKSVSVVTADEIAAQHADTALEVLRDVPGVFIRRSGAAGRTTSAVIRGSTADQIVVLVDGAEVNSATTGSFDFSTLPADFIERIEVLRGSASTLYGSQAIGGVINLITTRGEGPMRTSYQQEFGTLHAFREIIATQAEMGPLRYHLGASRLDSHGLGSGDDVEITHLAGAGTLTLTDRLTADVALTENASSVGIDDGAFRPDPNRYIERDQLTLSTTLTARLLDAWAQDLRFSLSDDDLLDVDVADPGSTQSTSKSRFNTTRFGAEWIHHLDLREAGRLTTGFELNDDEAESTRFTKTVVTWAWFLQHEFDVTDRVTLIGGVRNQRHNTFGQETTSEASASFRVPVTETRLRANFSQGFRAPDLNELFFPNFGNEHLTPEESDTFELGLGQEWREGRVGGELTLFHTEVDDLIQAVRISATASQAQNMAETEMEGFELEGHMELWPGMRVSGSWSYTDAEEEPSKEELVRIPKHVLGFNVDYAFLTRWRVHLNTTLVDHREESVATNRRERTKGYAKVDGSLTFQANDHLQLYGRVENLLDRHYSEVLGFPAPGTLFFIGGKVEL